MIVIFEANFNDVLFSLFDEIFFSYIIYIHASNEKNITYKF